MSNPEFKSFRSIGRYSRDIIITEKIDGTNAQIMITPEGEMFVGSRTRWITPENDNFGFAAWCQENKEELLKLGHGRHYGEWWGKGIQRGYGLKERRFSLFNTHRWNEENLPKCCHVVPVLYKGPFDDYYDDGTQVPIVKLVMDDLKTSGSIAAPGFMKPEGICIFHTGKVEVMFKKTFEKDNHGKEWSNG